MIRKTNNSVQSLDGCSSLTPVLTWQVKTLIGPLPLESIFNWQPYSSAVASKLAPLGADKITILFSPSTLLTLLQILSKSS